MTNYQDWKYPLTPKGHGISVVFVCSNPDGPQLRGKDIPKERAHAEMVDWELAGDWVYIPETLQLVELRAGRSSEAGGPPAPTHAWVALFKLPDDLN